LFAVWAHRAGHAAPDEPTSPPEIGADG
jgi:hypothetical protein